LSINFNVDIQNSTKLYLWQFRENRFKFRRRKLVRNI